MLQGETYRITVLTDRLLRLEYQENGRFTDALTQTVVNRSFPRVPYEAREENGNLVVETAAIRLVYDKQEFTTNGLSIELKDFGTTWHYSIIYGNSDRNLFGTARTLDLTDGLLELSPGIFGHNGYAVIDDSASALQSGTEFVPRDYECKDLYVFCYGMDFTQGLKDFFALCGQTPLLPRYAFGNWWSRYHRYTEESYRALLARFKEEHIPLSVAVLDMDWHVTEVDEKYGTGWTGYTWDAECFPDPKRFLSFLKEEKLAVTLNLHPADGVRAFEAVYPAVAKRMGIDPATERPIEFDFSDPAFRDAYFTEIMHPNEELGVDFWWIDWQQGTKRGGNSVDPLFLLNHYHFEDQKGRDIRPLIFSRYAGVGSHRYPIGFSGDTVTSWKSLALQPYFTATASNIGYGFWSHDIGGHMLGDKDEERLIRWIQFGVFSPIMRLHSSNSPFFLKEPWNVSEPYRTIMGEFMRLRHRLIPYLYTMNLRAHSEGRMLIEPVYYRLPQNEDAYDVPDSYFFGATLLVGAITRKVDPSLKIAPVLMLLPKGKWYDIFTGQIYIGACKRKLYRRIETLPVLLPAGGIVPESLSDTENGTENPKALRLLLGYGADGEFTLYEDDGVSQAYERGESVTTKFFLRCEKGEATVSIEAAEGTYSLIPSERFYELVLYGAAPTENARVTRNGEALSFETDDTRHCVIVTLPAADVRETQTVLFSGFAPAKNDHEAMLFSLLSYAWCETGVKEKIYDAFTAAASPQEFLNALSGFDVREDLKDAVREIFSDL